MIVTSRFQNPIIIGMSIVFLGVSSIDTRSSDAAFVITSVATLNLRHAFLAAAVQVPTAARAVLHLPLLLNSIILTCTGLERVPPAGGAGIKLCEARGGRRASPKFFMGHNKLPAAVWRSLKTHKQKHFRECQSPCGCEVPVWRSGFPYITAGWGWLRLCAFLLLTVVREKACGAHMCLEQLDSRTPPHGVECPWAICALDLLPAVPVEDVSRV